MTRPNELNLFSNDGTHWRWRLRAPNGRIIGASSEAYRDRRDAIANIAQIFAADIHAANHVIPDNHDRIEVVKAISERYEISDLIQQPEVAVTAAESAEAG